MNIVDDMTLECFCAMRPDFAQDVRELVSLDFLATNPDAKYTTGQYGIAKAHFLTSTGKVMVNPTQALVILAKAHTFDRVEKMLNSKTTSEEVIKEFRRDYDKMKKFLYPKNGDANMIKNPFYRRVFGSLIPHDLFRNVDNTKLNARIFHMTLISHFKCVNTQLGGKYTENEIAAINEEIYEEVRDEVCPDYGMGELQLAIVEEKVSDILKENYGWAFDYREYILTNIDWEIVDLIGDAFPQIRDAVLEAADSIFVKTPNGYAIGGASNGAMKLESELTNPIGRTVTYRAIQASHVAKIEDLIEFNHNDCEAFRQRNKEMSDEQATMEYLKKKVGEFLWDCMTRRGKEEEEKWLERDKEQIATYIYIKKMRLKE